MLERMEADRKADQERMEADRRDLKELIKMIQAYQAKTDAVLPAMQVTETSRKETAAAFKTETEVNTMACQNGGASKRADLSGQETGGGRRM
jgi:hypothetical protein